jgi:fatty-acyl-CoA synthase
MPAVIDPDTLRRGAPGPGRRDRHPWPAGVQGLLAAARGHRGRVPRLDGKRFFRTGDLGRIDEDGYFFITDRLKRMINASGYKVWPARSRTCCCTSIRTCRRPASSRCTTLPRRDRQGGGRAARRIGRQARRGRARSVGARATWPPTRCRAVVEFVDATAQVGLGQGALAPAAGPGTGGGGRVTGAGLGCLPCRGLAPKHAWLHA